MLIGGYPFFGFVHPGPQDFDNYAMLVMSPHHHHPPGSGRHHHHHHHHHHGAGNIRMAFLLNSGFTILEFAGGIMTQSTAILADAVHDLGDSIALAQSWYFEHKATSRPRSSRYSYGYQRFSLLGALISTIVLLCSSLFVLVNAVGKLFDPGKPDAQGMVLLAIVGVAVNGFAMVRLSKDKGLNARVVALHLLEDVLGWVAVLVVAVVLLFVDVPLLDPLLAIVITLYILSGVMNNLKTMVPVFLQAVPDTLNLGDIVAEITDLAGVASVHHAHIWSLDGNSTVFTAHLELDQSLDVAAYMALKDEIGSLIREYGMDHSTIEIEYPGERCRIDTEHHALDCTGHH